jgi:hypothetical protein
MRDEAADANFVAVTVVLAWVVSTLFFIAQPFPAVAVDPVASLRVTLLYTGLWAGLTLPVIALLSIAALLIRRGGGRLRLTQPNNQAKPGAFVLWLGALVWLWISLLIRSEPSLEFTPGVLWLLFTALLVLAWLGVVASSAREMRSRLSIGTATKVIGHLLAIPVALLLLFVIIPGDAPRRIRFEMSEDSLTAYVNEFEETGDKSMSTIQMVGLYQVGPPDRRHGCVRITTNGEMDHYAGFAYCPGGPLPTKPNEEFDHFQGDWWRFQVWH